MSSFSKKRRPGREPGKESGRSKSSNLLQDANFAAFLQLVAAISPVTASETAVEMTRKLRSLSRDEDR